jgi:transmembrane sensor
MTSRQDHPDLHFLSVVRREAGIPICPVDPGQLDAAFLDLERRIAVAEQQAPTGSQPRRPRWLVAAGAAGLASVVLGVVSLLDRGPLVIDGKPAARVHSTGTGQRATVTLADGSRITLAPRSSIAIESTAESRVMRLTGEALFDVKNVSTTPFIVETGAATTRVLGTVFTVRRYAGDAETRVVVLSGKVVTQTPRAALVLESGMTGMATDSTVVSATTSEMARRAEWTKGRIVFEETSVPNMLVELSRWYGYTFRLSDSTLVREVMTAEFRADALRETLQTLKDILDVSLTVDDSVITLHSNRKGTPVKVSPRIRITTTHSREVGK